MRREFSKGIKVAAFLADCLNYNSNTGVISWKVRPREHFKTDGVWKIINSRNAGKDAGSPAANGYLTIRVSGKLLYAHRVAWMLATGDEIPPGYMVDHWNGNKADNRLVNLRLATRSQNNCNQAQRSYRDLPKGVHYDKRRGKFLASVRLDGKQYFCGRYATVAEAEMSVRNTRARLHGEFARDGGAS